jgi:LysR family transcriptional repressor of citA
MDIENLRTFCVVADHKSFIKAAEILNVTQSGISRRIQSLENELGVPLFVRTPQSVALTKKGQSFLPYAERMVQIYQEGQKTILDSINEEKVVIAAPPAASITLLPKILKAFREEHQIHVSINTASSQYIFDMLIDKTINVGFTSVAFPSSLLNYELVNEEEVVCVGHPELVKQYFADSGIIKQPVPIILNSMNIAPWDSINPYFFNHPLFEIVMTAFYIQVIEQLVRMGVGLATLPISLVRDELESGELVKVLLPEFVIPPKSIYMATYKQIQMEPSIHKFQDTVRRVTAK